MSFLKLWKWDLIWGCTQVAEIVSCFICSLVFSDFRFMGIAGIALLGACICFLYALISKSKESEKTVGKFFKELRYVKNPSECQEAFFPLYSIGFIILIWLLIFIDIGWIQI